MFVPGRVSRGHMRVCWRGFSSDIVSKIQQEYKEDMVRNLAETYVVTNTPVVKHIVPYTTLPGTRQTPVDDLPDKILPWKDFEKFPEKKPDNMDLLTYLLLRDANDRHKALNMNDFCVGSIVRVRRKDSYIKNHTISFIGICIKKFFWENLPGASFRLRNVIRGEPLEIVYNTFNPFIVNIQVVRHQTYGYSDMSFLRDAPIELSVIDENMDPEPYNPIPKEVKYPEIVQKVLNMHKHEQFRLLRPKKPQNPVDTSAPLYDPQNDPYKRGDGADQAAAPGKGPDSGRSSANKRKPNRDKLITAFPIYP